MLTIEALSTEFIRVPVAAREDGAIVVPTSDQVEMALVATGSAPGVDDWSAAEWETDNTTSPPTYYVRMLIGPGAGEDLMLTAGVLYDVCVRITDNPETIVRNTGALAAL